jgi:hypothetical protein
MLIQQTRVRTLKGRLGPTRKGSKLVIGARLVPSLVPLLVKAGFPQDFKIGDGLLPAAIGPVSLFNAEGGFIVHRDKPMETAYRQVEWEWEQWHGQDTVTNSKIVDVSYQRYPRTEIKPPSIELKVAVTADGQRVLVAPPMTYMSDDDKHLTHVVNLFLEILGFCEVFTADLGEIIKAPLRRLNWKLLPEGKRPWKEVRADIKEVVKRAPQGNQPVIEHRLEEINKYEPDFVAIGQAGFAGYVVFGFTKRDLFLFESIYFGNATYVFGDQWESLSKLTKVQVLDNNLHKDRVVHRKGWESHIRKLLGSTPDRPR